MRPLAVTIQRCARAIPDRNLGPLIDSSCSYYNAVGRWLCSVCHFLGTFDPNSKPIHDDPPLLLRRAAKCSVETRQRDRGAEIFEGSSKERLLCLARPRLSSPLHIKGREEIKTLPESENLTGENRSTSKEVREIGPLSVAKPRGRSQRWTVGSLGGRGRPNIHPSFRRVPLSGDHPPKHQTTNDRKQYRSTNQ